MLIFSKFGEWVTSGGSPDYINVFQALPDAQLNRTSCLGNHPQGNSLKKSRWQSAKLLKIFVKIFAQTRL